MQSDHELDKIIDAALADYVSEPRIGLDQRVLARIASESSQRRALWLRRSAAAFAAASLVIAFLLMRPVPKQNSVASLAPTPAVTDDDNRTLQPAPSMPTNTPRNHGTARAVVHRPVTTESLPKLAQFPTPSPLTEEERALLTFVQDSKPELIQQLETRKDAPLTIKSIQIEDIQIDPLPSGSK